MTDLVGAEQTLKTASLRLLRMVNASETKHNWKEVTSCTKRKS